MFSYDLIQQFNETEISIYKYIQSNRDKVIYMTIRELAAQLHLSTSSIVRFYNKNGCDSYTEFKARLRKELADTERIQPESDLQELLRYFRLVNTGAFEAKIRQGARLVREAELVLFIGQGSSGTLAKYGARCFSNVGRFSVGLEDPYYPLAQMKERQVVVIALSASGESSTVIAFMDECRIVGFKVMSITNTADSTIARMSDWNIAYYMEPQYAYEIYNTLSQVPTLFLIEALARRI